MESARCLLLNECPYGAENCPKIENIEKSLDKLSVQIQKLSKILYFMLGVIYIELGVNLWGIL